MSDSTSSPPADEIYISQKFKAFISEPDGCAVVKMLEEQYQCTITVADDMLAISDAHNVPIEVTKIENILREMWRKKVVQQTIRVAALNASCTHICQMILPRAYSAVVILYSSDVRRRSKCGDILIEHSDGKVDIYGSETSVSIARELLIEVLTDHFGKLEIDVPYPRRTTRINYVNSLSSFSSLDSTPMDTSPIQPLNMKRAFSAGAHNDTLSSTPSDGVSFDEAHPILTSNFEPPAIFGSSQNSGGSFPRSSNLFIPPPTFDFASAGKAQQPAQVTRINNVEKIRVWVNKENVGRILGNRANIKKQIEGQYNCVITVRTDCVPQFGMTAVDIMSQNAEHCKNARDAIVALNTSHIEPSPSGDSGFSSPVSSVNPQESPNISITPDKQRFARRSNFRDQPKVLLALTPRKSPSMEE